MPASTLQYETFYMTRFLRTAMNADTVRRPPL